MPNNTPSTEESVLVHVQDDWEKRFNNTFYEGDRNSVFCRKHKAFATPIELKRFISQELTLAREQERRKIREKIEMMKKTEDWLVNDDIKKDEALYTAAKVSVSVHNLALSKVLEQLK